MPDLNAADVANAAVKIQKVYRGFQSRRQMQEDMPKLKCAKVVKTDQDEDLPDLKSADVAAGEDTAF